MGVQVRIEPEDQEDNEYATPCYFNFDEWEEAVAFLRLIAKHGDGVAMYIRESE